jgi:glycosyltransferase involved in cell wall biosynthesis
MRTAPAGDILNQPARFQPPRPLGWSLSHVNIILPSLALGGAERMVLDVAHGICQSGSSGTLYVLNELSAEYPPTNDPDFPVVSLAGMGPADQMRTIAAQVLCSPTPVVISHMINTRLLQTLWCYGVPTIPVIHNSEMGWHEPVSCFDEPHVPLLVAVSEDVRRQLLAAGCPKPVSVIRHEIQRWKTEEEHERDRAEVRSRFGLTPDTLLIGMVGQFKAQKAYVRGVRVLAALERSRPVKLMIVGGWDHNWGAARQAHAATVAQAQELDVLDDLILVGAAPNATSYISAFDIFLNTSVYEGLSLACLEAVQLGRPLVLSDVGGQREIGAGPNRRLIGDPSDIPAYVAAVEALAGRSAPGPAPAPRSRHLVPQLWSLLADQALPPAASRRVDTLFVTSNLNQGGAQRSLTNLLVRIAPTHRSWLCVIDRVIGDGFIDMIRKTAVGISSPPASGSIIDRAQEILVLARRLGVRNIVFWNLESALKLVIAKAVEWYPIALTDVSPGPMLFDELESADELQRRIAFTADQYLDRLDHFVSKYGDGGPPTRFMGRPRHVHVIRNGVEVPPLRHTSRAGVRPASVDPRFALVTCGRIVPNKMLDALVAMMVSLTPRLPSASLTIVGGVDQRHVGYFEAIERLIDERGVRNVHFVGPRSDVFEFLHEFRVFVMMSRSQGCPNASLEAMAMGLPVIANPDGGTAEQVLDGRTGFLVDPADPELMAGRALELLADEGLARRMGADAREHVRANFSLEAMAEAYLGVLQHGLTPASRSGARTRAS